MVLKSIDPEVVHGATRLRFEHETRVLRELTGTGLTGLYDSGEVAEQLYLVQPYIAGATLEACSAPVRCPCRRCCGSVSRSPRPSTPPTRPGSCTGM